MQDDASYDAVEAAQPAAAPDSATAASVIHSTARLEIAPCYVLTTSHK